MDRALLAERHPLWARSCPELNDIDFIRLGLLRCISALNEAAPAAEKPIISIKL
jgi:hypothetical protein